MKGVQMGIDAHELNQLHARFGKHQPILDTELRRAETAGLTVLRDEARIQARQIATDGRLPGSITYQSISGGLAGIVGSVAATAGSIAEGRKPGNQPSADLLANWVARRGLAGETFSVKSHRRLRSSKPVRAAELSLAWKIAMTIRERGTKPLPFITGAAQAKAAQIQAIFSDAVNRALVKLAHV